MKRLIACGMAAALASCAMAPDKIVATAVPEVIYEGHACPQLKVEKAETQLSLSTLSAQQSSAVTGDTVGVIFLGLPVSSMTGNDVSGKVGEAKGRIAAIESTGIFRRLAALA